MKILEDQILCYRRESWWDRNRTRVLRLFASLVVMAILIVFVAVGIEVYRIIDWQHRKERLHASYQAAANLELESRTMASVRKLSDGIPTIMTNQPVEYSALIRSLQDCNIDPIVKNTPGFAIIFMHELPLPTGHRLCILYCAPTSQGGNLYLNYFNVMADFQERSFTWKISSSPFAGITSDHFVSSKDLEIRAAYLKYRDKKPMLVIPISADGSHWEMTCDYVGPEFGFLPFHAPTKQ